MTDAKNEAAGGASASNAELGYVVGATVRQYHHTTLFDDAVIARVYANGALDVVRNDGTKNGWSVRTCVPVVPNAQGKPTAANERNKG